MYRVTFGWKQETTPLRKYSLVISRNNTSIFVLLDSKCQRPCILSDVVLLSVRRLDAYLTSLDELYKNTHTLAAVLISDPVVPTELFEPQGRNQGNTTYVGS